MVPRLKDCHEVVIRNIDESVGVVDAAGPGARQYMFEWFRFPDSLKGVIPEDVLDKRIDALEGLPVLSLPVQVVFPPCSSPSKQASRQG